MLSHIDLIHSTANMKIIIDPIRRRSQTIRYDSGIPSFLPQ